MGDKGKENTYRVFEYKKEFDCSFLELKLYGIDGWELVSTFVLSGDTLISKKESVCYLFKREVFDTKKSLMLASKAAIVEQLESRQKQYKENK